jgi:cytochrome c
MRRYGFLLLALFLTGRAAAEGPVYQLGKTPTDAEILAIDTLVDQDGNILPEGRGTPAEGGEIFAQRWVACHGLSGEGTNTVAGVAPMLIARDQAGTDGIRHLHFATTLFSFVFRAMPMNEEKSLSEDQAYALAAFLLFRNGIIHEDEEMNTKSLPQVVMPNRDAWSAPPETTG